MPRIQWCRAAPTARGRRLWMRALTSALKEHADPVAALASYEKQRLEATTRIVLTNRTNPPDAILREVFQRTGDQPFGAIEDVISREELVGLSEGYKQIAGDSKDALRGEGTKSPAVTVELELGWGTAVGKNRARRFGE